MDLYPLKLTFFISRFMFYETNLTFIVSIHEETISQLLIY